MASFSYTAGETVKLRFPVVDEAGAVANITGTTPLFIVRPLVPGLPAVASTEESPQTALTAIISATGGIYEAYIEPEVTAGLSGTYRYESWLIDASGDESVPARGYLIFTRSLR